MDWIGLGQQKWTHVQLWLSLQPVGCTSALACDVKRYCSCSCRLWRYIIVIPLPFTYSAPVPRICKSGGTCPRAL